ncbi:hypothetical protein AB9F45_39885, partial [Rhizobium leguminosarum]|uniref:hypothetical protein n=1 Tax=Rhizobium leguminosarum TaxID=384 RepID=UPI003F98F161
VTRPDGSSIVSAYAKGKPFQPGKFFGEAFYQQINAAAAPAKAPVVNFIKTESGNQAGGEAGRKKFVGEHLKRFPNG